jgi:hypothetical protein
MNPKTKSLAAFAAFVALSAPAFSADERVEVKGFYREDGAYVTQRVVEPLARPAVAAPALPADLDGRRSVIEKHFLGQTVRAKISFPACRGGVVVSAEDLGQANADLFKKVNKYGSAIEKEAGALITGFHIGGNVIDVELNGGGYGTFGHILGRVAADVPTLGIWELIRDGSSIRYRKGSRLRIEAAHDFTAQDLTFEAVAQKLAVALEVL